MSVTIRVRVDGHDSRVPLSKRRYVEVVAGYGEGVRAAHAREANGCSPKPGKPAPVHVPTMHFAGGFQSPRVVTSEGKDPHERRQFRNAGRRATREALQGRYIKDNALDQVRP